MLTLCPLSSSMPNVSQSAIHDNDAFTNSDSKSQIQVPLGLRSYLWLRPSERNIFLWRWLCINSLAYLFRHLEEKKKNPPNLSSTFIRNLSCHLASNRLWREWLQPSPCPCGDSAVLPSWNGLVLGKGSSETAVMLSSSSRLGGWWVQKKPPSSPEGTCGPHFSLRLHHPVTLAD